MTFCYQHISQTPLSVTLLWQLKVSHAGSIYTMKISTFYKLSLIYCFIHCVNQGLGNCRLWVSLLFLQTECHRNETGQAEFVLSDDRVEQPQQRPCGCRPGFSRYLALSEVCKTLVWTSEGNGKNDNNAVGMCLCCDCGHCIVNSTQE